MVHALGLNVFVGSMALVCLAGDAVTFLFAWKGMTLASYALVVSDGSAENGHAGLVYVVAASRGHPLRHPGGAGTAGVAPTGGRDGKVGRSGRRTS